MNEPPAVLSKTEVHSDKSPPAQIQKTNLTSQFLFHPRERMDLNKYSIQPQLAGAMVEAKINNQNVNPNQTYDQGELVIKGWAGDIQLGVNYDSVYFAMCDNIIARAQVDKATPQIAQAVHSNLGRAGFQVILRLEALPRCDNPIIQGFVRNNDSGNLNRLAGSINLSLGADEQILSGYIRGGFAPQKKLAQAKIDLTKGARPMHSCANEECPIIGYLESFDGDGSSVLVSVRNEQNGWRLVQNGAATGWIQ